MEDVKKLKTGLELTESVLKFEQDRNKLLVSENRELKKQLALCGVVLGNCYKTEEFSVYTPKDNEDVVVIEDSFKHKRTFDVNDFNKLMYVLHSVQDY